MNPSTQDLENLSKAPYLGTHCNTGSIDRVCFPKKKHVLTYWIGDPLKDFSPEPLPRKISEQFDVSYFILISILQ